MSHWQITALDHPITWYLPVLKRSTIAPITKVNTTTWYVEQPPDSSAILSKAIYSGILPAADCRRHCVQAFEHYSAQVQAKGVFGPFYNQTGSRQHRAAYANTLAHKLRAIDPAVFERGYYWPAFVEEIENGL